MKKRIGTLYNKPIIEGDINLKTPNEIHKNELKGGGDNSSGSSVSKYAPRYYKIAEGAPGEMGNINAYVATIKIKVYENISILPPFVGKDIRDGQVLGFGFAPFYGEVLNKHRFIDSFESLIHSILEASGSSENFNLIMSYFTEITEEEYYKID